MPGLSIQIIRFVDDHQPGFVEFVLTDASGVTHHFIEKVPVISDKNLNAQSSYPVDEVIPCGVRRQFINEAGIAVAEVDTAVPWSIESVSGQSVFVVPLSVVTQ